MKILRIIKKSIKDAFKSVFRNFSLSMASVSCTAITLILVSIALLVTYNVNSITKDIEDVLTIVVLVDKNANSADVNKVKNEILAIDNVDEDNLKYDSSDDIKVQKESLEIREEEVIEEKPDLINFVNPYGFNINTIPTIQQEPQLPRGVEYVA